MIQIYADEALAYDSRLEDFDIVGLKVTNSLNAGGTAEIILPVGHPAYSLFVGHRTIVTIYRDGVLRFRGRVLYHADTFYGQRTVTCEGEMCLLRDGINRPYLYQATPRSCFVTLINAYNSQMSLSPFKQFKVGEVTVTDANDYVRLESESAETFLATLNKLIERCGGYVTFTTAEDGSRVINWLSTLDNRSEQVIEFGENLLDFSSTDANNDTFATTIIPYGAKDETTKKRITIASVNGGVDYVTDQKAQEAYGNIVATMTWDDVTEPSNLLKKARAYLDANKILITSLELTALDLSYLDKDINSFAVGDVIRVTSAPHRVDEDFQLTQMTEDLLNPAQSHITLGKDVQSLTRSDVTSGFKTQSELSAVRVQLDAGMDLSGYVQQEDLEGYAKQGDLEGYAKQGDLVVYAKQEDLGGYAKQEDLEGYARQEDLEGYAKQGDLVVYAKQEDLEGYAKQEDLESYAEQEDLEQAVRARQDVIDIVDGATSVGSTKRETKVQGSAVTIGDAENVTHIYGGDRIKVHSRMHLFGSMLDFDNNQGVRIYNNDGNVYYIVRVDANNNTFIGTDSNNLYLRGPVVYLRETNAVVTSDKRNKHSIEELPQAYVDMLDKLTPVRFKYKDGKSGRYHVGFIAQDVERALTEAGLSAKDFGGFVDLDGDGEHLGLAYDEFIGLLFQKIRRLENKIEVLEEK